jgi:hypothetical protein
MLEQNMLRLAEMCGVTPDYLYLIRDGRYLPSAKILGRIELGLKRLREQREAAGDLIGWARSPRKGSPCSVIRRMRAYTNRPWFVLPENP